MKSILRILIILLLIGLFSSCENKQNFTILYKRYNGTSVKKCSTVVRASSPKVAKTIFETNNYVSTDSIVIDRVVSPSLR